MAAELRKGGEAHKFLDSPPVPAIVGISAAKQNPAAHIYASDWKNVLESQQNAQAMGLRSLTPASRQRLRKRDFFGQRLRSVVLITDFLQHSIRPLHNCHHAQGACRATQAAAPQLLNSFQS